MQALAQDLMEKIIELRIQLEYQIANLQLNEAEDNIQFNAKELISAFEQLKYDYTEAFIQFVDLNPIYKSLDIISQNNIYGLQQIISCITQDTEQTVANIVEKVQTQQFYQWIENDSKQNIINSENENDEAVYTHILKFNLPKIKQDELGSCIALAFSGILSENYEIFQNQQINEIKKQSILRNLIINNRKYINFDFNSLTIEDQTEQFSKRKTLYRPRGIATRKMIDSAYTDGKHLFAVVSTNNSDTTSQGAQAFELQKILQNNYDKQQLDLDIDKNLIPTVILFNNAFFCTENSDKIENNEQYNNIRTKFDQLFDKPLNKNSLDKINGLVTLSMLGNKELNWPRFPYSFDICEIIHCYPITAGSDTLWIHTKFEQLKIYNNPQRTQKLFNFLLDYSNEVIDSLLKIKPNAEETIIGDIKSSYERLIAGITRNFNSYNIGRELNEEEIKKLNSLEEKIENFNINHPNHTIDSNLLIALTPGAFEQQGKTLTRSINRRVEKFNFIATQEKEDNEAIIAQINQAINNSEQDCITEDNVFYKLDAIAYDLYKDDISGKTLKISSFLNVIYKNIQLSDINKCSYFNIPTSYNPNYNYNNNFIKSTGNTRKNFLSKIDNIAYTNLELAKSFESADSSILDFLRQFHTEEGRQNIIEAGGLISSVENLCKLLEEPMKNIQRVSLKRYDEYKNKTPFYKTEHRNLGSYWNLQVEKAIKYDNYDGMVAIIHEYLHRIENKYKDNESVSGKSLSDLPKKILILKQMGESHEHVNEAVNVLIAKYNYLGELFDNQNKNKKKYKPKHYYINA
jgi:hypothetical protein